MWSKKLVFYVRQPKFLIFLIAPSIGTAGDIFIQILVSPTIISPKTEIMNMQTIELNQNEAES